MEKVYFSDYYIFCT